MASRSLITMSAAVLAIATATLPMSSRAQDSQPAPDATLHLEGGAVAAGIGYVWGNGKVDYKGAPHAFGISGLSIVDVGAAKIDAAGNVYNLKQLGDFNGTYTAFAAGATIAGGGGVAYLRNQKGVVIKLNSSTQGLRFNLSASGVELKLKDN